MLLPVFEKYIFLQSLGWGIANSLWQVGLLWLLYRAVTLSNKNLSALFKYHFSLLLLFASFAWFVTTTFQNYLAITNAGSPAAVISWMKVSQNITAALNWLSVAYFVLLLMHIFMFVKKLKGLFLLQKSDVIKAPVDIRLFTEQTALHIGVKRKVSIWLSEKAGVPSVIGFIKPMILLPVTALNNLTTQQAEAVILHELAHIKRNDYLVNILQCVAELLLFFNPFARLLGNEIRKERENCCDDWVLNYQYSKHDYAAALLVLEQSRSASVHFALAATNGKKNLLGRIKRLFAEEPKVNLSSFQKIKFVSISFSLLLLVFFVFPVANNKTAATFREIRTFPVISYAAVSPAVYSENRKLSIIINDEPVTVKKVTKEKKAVVKKTAEILEPQEIELNSAMINEELLKHQQEMEMQDIALQAVNTEMEAMDKVYVKIEEEQAGKKDKKICIVELNNDNGVPVIKPLFILDKKVKSVTTKAKNKLTGAQKKTTAKKRTTA